MFLKGWRVIDWKLFSIEIPKWSFFGVDLEVSETLILMTLEDQFVVINYLKISARSGYYISIDAYEIFLDTFPSH